MRAGKGWGSECFDGLSRGDAARWGIALVVILGAGWGVAQGVQRLPTPALVLGEPEPAILIDLAPMAPEEVIPDIIEPVAEVAPEPEPEMAEELPPETIEPEAAPEIVTPEVAEAVAPVIPEVQQPIEEPEPLPEPVTPESVAPTEPEEVEDIPEEPPLPAEEVEDIVEATSDIPMPVMISSRLQERRENTAALPRPVVRQPAAPKPTVSTPAPSAQTSAPASPPPTASTISPQQWQAQALAQLDRRKVYPRSAQSDGIQGTVDISFSVSASGQIASVSVVRSSGSSILDQAALDTARRASPLPPPPPGYAGRALTAAIRFSLN